MSTKSRWSALRFEKKVAVEPSITNDPTHSMLERMEKNMNKWVLLTLAIFSEVVATSSLKSTEGFTKLLPSLIVLIGYGAAFYFLSLTLDTIPIGVAYAVWSGVGVAVIALISVLFLDQRLDAAALIGIGLIVAGVVVLRLFSDASIE